MPLLFRGHYSDLLLMTSYFTCMHRGKTKRTSGISFGLSNESHSINMNIFFSGVKILNSPTIAKSKPNVNVIYIKEYLNKSLQNFSKLVF